MTRLGGDPRLKSLLPAAAWYSPNYWCTVFRAEREKRYTIRNQVPLCRRQNADCISAVKETEMAATIKQVAALADVSTATVSYVLNGTGTVTEATRQRVMDVVARL